MNLPTVFALEPMPDTAEEAGRIVAHRATATYSGGCQAHVACESTLPARRFRMLAVADNLAGLVPLCPPTWRVLLCEACEKVPR